MHLIYLILLGSAIISNTALTIVLYYKSQKSVAIVSFIFFLLLINIWILPKFLMNLTFPNSEIFESLSRISALGYVLVPVAFLLFALAYCLETKLFEKMVFWILLLVPAIAFLYLSWTTETLGVHSFEKATLYAWGYETPAGTYFVIFVSWFILLMTVSLGLLVRYYLRLQEEMKKQQAFFVLLSVFVPLSIGIVTNGVLPLLDIFIFPMGLVLTNLFAGIIVYAIFKYGLFIITPLTVLSNIEHAIVTVDINGYILQMNTFSEKLLRVTLAHATGTLLEEALHIENRYRRQKNQLKRILDVTYKEGKSATFDDYAIRNRKKEVYPSLISVTPVRDKNKIIGATLFLKDNHIEKTVEREKDDLIGYLSHELKTPITSIKAYNQLLLREIGNSSNKSKQLVLKIDSQLDKLTRLIKNYFEFSQLQTGKIKTKRDFFGIDDFVGTIIETMKVTYSNRRIELVGNTKNTFVFADKDQTEEVITNLLSNAFNHSPKEKPVTVTLSSNSKKVTISVSDRGIGIAPAYHKKIFTRFFQVNEGSKAGGLGIGLYVASTIVKSHGGSMWVDSNLGKGSTFYFTLPVKPPNSLS